MIDTTNLLPGIRAILFDIDGTLLDTFDYIYGAFEHTFEVHGIARLPHEQISQLMGGPLEEVYGKMAPGRDATALAETHRQFQEQNVNLAKLFPNTVMVLDALKQRGFKLATITTRSNRTSVLSLEQNGIAGYFDIVVSSEDVLHHKPDPEPIFKALRDLEVKPVDAIMIGDTSADIMAGKNAGTMTVAALYGFGGERLRHLQPDYAIGDLKDLLAIV
jgi:pyrophosphatase PpaX